MLEIPLREGAPPCCVSPSSVRDPAGSTPRRASSSRAGSRTCGSTSWTGCPARTGWCATAWRPTTRRSSRCRTICARAGARAGAVPRQRRGGPATGCRPPGCGSCTTRWCTAWAPPPTGTLGVPGEELPRQPLGDRVRVLVQRASGRRRRRLRARRAVGRRHRRRATSRWTWPGCWPAARTSCAPPTCPQAALGALAASRVRDIHMVGRRGPSQAQVHHQGAARAGRAARTRTCSSDPAELALDPGVRGPVRRCPPRPARAMWRCCAAGPRARRGARHPRAIRLRFFLRPVELLGDGGRGRARSASSGPRRTAPAG